MILLLAFAFFSGLVTILAPCVWPLLPIVLSSAASSQDKHRPLGITTGIMLSFGVFTLTISSVVRIFHIDPDILRTIAIAIIATLGLVLLIPALSKVLEYLVSKLSQRFSNRSGNSGGGFWTGFLTGCSLGVVWAPCAGPILASIAALAATGQVTVFVVALTAAYVAGIGVPLFILAYGGQKLLTQSRRLSPYTGKIQQIFGLVMILTALAMYTGYDRRLQVVILNALPGYSAGVNNLQSLNIITKQLENVTNETGSKTELTASLINTNDLFNSNFKAPDLVGINQWLNSSPISLKDLRGKVVLVDFWTYTCINCIRTLPYVTSWYDKYHDQGFVVIGVHTPEFEFEKKTSNVEAALGQYKIHYPVAQDNDYATWSNFNNRYWPAEYLIDSNGVVRRTHFGEGEYDAMEQSIQALLAEAGKNVTSSLVTDSDQTPTGQLSPETYLGANRMQYYFPNVSILPGQATFSLNQALPVNSFSLGGEWNVTPENVITVKNSSLLYNFRANKVYLVLRPGQNKAAHVKVYLDGVLVDRVSAGSDVKDGVLTIDKDRLYNLIDLHGLAGKHILRLEFDAPGVEAFAFTFG